MSRRGESIETERRSVVAKGWGGNRKWEVTANGHKVSFEGDENVLKSMW